jgi:RNA polymerase sigma-70 factor (ECF subfamily)
MGLTQLDKTAWFKSIFDEHYQSIRRFIYFRCGDDILSDDIAQEVFIKLWDVRETVRPETVLSLLYTIASNLVKNHHKHQKVVLNFQKNTTKSELNTEEADHNLRQQQMKERLERVLAAMPEKCRVTFLMNRIEELTYSEIAERLGLSVKAVEKRMSEALEYIRSNLEYKV